MKKSTNLMLDFHSEQSSSQSDIQQSNNQKIINSEKQKVQSSHQNDGKSSNDSSQNLYVTFQQKILKKRASQLQNPEIKSPKLKGLNSNFSSSNIANTILPKKKYSLKLLKPASKLIIINSTSDEDIQKIQLYSSVSRSQNSFKLEAQQENKQTNQNTKQNELKVTPRISLERVILHDFDSSFDSEDQDTKENETQQIEEIEEEREEIEKEENEAFNIFTVCSNAEKIVINRNFFNLLFDHAQSTEKYNNRVQDFLKKSIPSNTAFIFEIHVYKNILKTQYQLWVEVNDHEKRLIATSYNPTTYLDKSFFTIQQVGLKNQRYQVGNLISNFTRSYYTLIGKMQTSQGNKKQYQEYQLLNININITRTLYMPLVDINQLLKYTPSSEKNLRDIFQHERFNQTKKTLFKLSSLKFVNYSQELYQHYNIRSSNKTLLIKDENDNYPLFIGKIASKKYKMLVGQNISPMQAFGFIIAHIQNY